MHSVVFRIFLLTIISFSSIVVIGQTRSLNEASALFKKRQYKEVLQILNNHPDIADNREAMFQRALSFYHSKEYSLAYRDLEWLDKKQFKPREISFFKARILHKTHRFSKAIEKYKYFLSIAKSSDSRRRSVADMIKRCAQGLKINRLNQLGFVENLGELVNSEKAEIRPVQSKNSERKFYFSSNRDLPLNTSTATEPNNESIALSSNYNMYSMVSRQGIWEEDGYLNPMLNGAGAELLHDLSEDGKNLYFSIGNEGEFKTIYIDTFSVESQKVKTLQAFDSPIRGELGDDHIFLVNDSTFIFSSRRSGGFGGYDLWLTQKRRDQWLEPVNLGKEINTAYNEISPFLTNDGSKLFFSSNHTHSIGGYDIFSSEYDAVRKNWNAATNLGMPINSADQEMYYRLSRNGEISVFSSDREGGFGNFDLYICYLLETDKTQLSIDTKYHFWDELFITSDQNISEMVVRATENNAVGQDKSLAHFELFYYEGLDVLESNRNKLLLKDLLSELRNNPTLIVEFNSHTRDEGPTHFELFFSIKRAEKLVQYLLNNGIPKNRIILKGFGNNYPVIKEYISTADGAPSQHFNNRVHVNFHLKSEEDVFLNRKGMDFPKSILDNRFPIYLSMVEGLSYRVEIKKTRQMFQDKVLSDYYDTMIEYDLNSNTNIYTIGLYNDYQSARDLVAEVKKDYPEAKVIAYLNGIRLEKVSISKYKNDYPDLLNYLKFEH